jgi:uracil-DNA glycosylase
MSGSKPTRSKGAEEYLPRQRSLTALAKAVGGCQGCELYADASQAVFGSGTAQARLMLIGEQPGDREDREGEPFVGPAGRLLDRAMTEAAIDSAEVYLTNAVKHFRHTERGKRRLHVTPDLSHMVACSPWLEAELAAVRPAGVVLLGASAGKAVVGGSFRLARWRGGPHSWPADSVLDLDLDRTPDWFVATTHPSAVLRSRDQREQAFAELVADLEVARETLADRSSAG